MSIKGIDTQIMITRTADMAKDTSAIQRHPETAQQNLANLNIRDSAHDQSRVQATLESETNNIRTDVDGEGSGAAGGGGGGQGEEELTREQLIELDLLVPPPEREQLIDIRV